MKLCRKCIIFLQILTTVGNKMYLKTYEVDLYELLQNNYKNFYLHTNSISRKSHKSK